jgi:hypothetical protein
LTRNSSETSEVVKVGIQSHEYNTLHSGWSNSDLMKVSSISINSDISEHSFIMSTKVDGFIRLKIDQESSVILFQTPMGRIILNGTSLEPAETFLDGLLVNITTPQIFQSGGELSSSSTHHTVSICSSFSI